MAKSKDRIFAVNMRYLVVFAVLLAVETAIALFVRDAFVRPYLGDVLVVALLYALVRAFVVRPNWNLPLHCFLFATLIEAAQFFDVLSALGLSQNKALRIMLGGTFDWADILCYAAAMSLLYLWQFIVKKGYLHKIFN